MTWSCWRLLAAFLLIPVLSRGQDVAVSRSATLVPASATLPDASLREAGRLPEATGVTARVVNTGTPQAGVTVNFRNSQGSGSLSSTTAVTNSAGYASVTLSLTNFTNVQVVACVASGSPCQTVYGDGVGAAALKLQAVAGAGQVVSGPAFQPLTVRATDSPSPPSPVLGATVLFQSTVLRLPGNDLTSVTGDTTSTPAAMPVLLSASQSTVVSDSNGLASVVPSVGPFTGLLELEIQVSAGTSAALQAVFETFLQTSSANNSTAAGAKWYGMLPNLTGEANSPCRMTSMRTRNPTIADDD